jgi:glutathione S-transferase
MAVEFVEFEQARASSGLRMVVVPRVPSPWGEAAKGILHVKGIPWVAVKLDPGNPGLLEWIGCASGPVAMYEDEPPRAGWAEILLLAERLAPEPRLLPRDPFERATAFGLSHEICGELGLGWVRRLESIHAGLSGDDGFPKPVAHYLADKYGYRADEADAIQPRIVALLNMLAGRLHAQRDAGSSYYMGDALTCVDVYSAAFMALFNPLPPEHCDMPDAMRAAFASASDAVRSALDPILFEHRDHVYQTYLELPLTLA